MQRAERFKEMIAYFSEHQPQAETELHYENPYQLLVAVILSAQCTDKRVNMTTPAIFERFPTPELLATSNYDELFPFIKSISYPSNKTKHLLGMAKMLVEDFGGQVPATLDELQKMPGVGRKTANVIVSVVFGKAAMAVDTHVFRVSKRLGLVAQNAATPLEVEKQLMRHLPEKWVAVAHHWLILHGRYICVARKPQCATCPLTHFCRYYETQQKNTKIQDSISD